jgi:hypothetical protein
VVVHRVDPRLILRVPRLLLVIVLQAGVSMPAPVVRVPLPVEFTLVVTGALVDVRGVCCLAGVELLRYAGLC